MNSLKRHFVIRILLAVFILVCSCAALALSPQDESANRNTNRNSNPNSSSPALETTSRSAKMTRIKVIPRKGNKRRASGPRVAQNVHLWIVSKPPTSQVLVDGAPQGATDDQGELAVTLAPGIHRIRVSKDGYVPSESEVELFASSEEREVEFELSLSLATLNIVTDPAGAEVYLDDMYKGASGPNGLLVLDRVNPSQPHSLRVRKDGWVQQVTPVTTYTGQLSIKLLPDSMRLKVTTDPPEAEVYLDDVYKGTSTADGTLMIEQVNPNQVHVVRAKKDGYKQDSAQVLPNSPTASIKLTTDPVVLLIKDIRRQVAQDHLAEAFASYEQLAKTVPDHQELPRLSEVILQGLQVRSLDRQKTVSPYGLALEMKDAQELSNLFRQARQWRPGDEAIDNFAKYWEVKLALLQADRTSSASEKEGLRRAARTALLELSERNLRNPHVVLDLGWSWWKLNDSVAAHKQFKAAQAMKADWAYPHFALGLLTMKAAENERGNDARKNVYGQAMESLTKAISLKHDFATAYALQSIINSLLKKREEAIANGLQAVAVDPQSAYAHFALGFAYFQKGKSGYRNSRDEYNRALSLGGAELDEAAKNSIQQQLAIIGRAIK